jgi:hypothetical protein
MELDGQELQQQVSNEYMKKESADATLKEKKVKRLQMYH